MAGLASSRLLPGACTTRYGEAPGDDNVLALVPESFGIHPESLPWFPVAHQDTPAGTVWTVFVCPPVQEASRRNLSVGIEAGSGDGPEVVLPKALWVFCVLCEGTAPLRRIHSPEGLWLSRWEDGQLASFGGPFPDDASIPSSWNDVRDQGEEIPWKEPDPLDLARLAEEYPEAQMLSLDEDRRRRDRLATRTSLCRAGAIAAVVLFAAIALQIPVWCASRSLAATEARLSSVRGELERLDRIRQSSLRDASYLAASSQALRRSGSPVGLLDGIARRLPQGAHLQSFEFESPPSESGWAARTDVRLPDWRGVSVLVDSVKLAPGVRDVHVATQQRDQERVHLVLALHGDWQ